MCALKLDPTICEALRLLHSSSSDSTDQLRSALDELIAKIDPSRTMVNVLPKKYLDIGREKEKEREKEKDKEMDREMERERERDCDEISLELLELELTCAVCRHLAIQEGSKFAECDFCHKLYHQECHSPIISETDAESGWQCMTCLDALDFDNASSINSPLMVIECPSSSTASGSMSPEKANSVSPPPQIPLDELPTPPKVVTPTKNIISGDQRLQIVKKKSNKHRENKRKNKK
ncbi:integrator complex subunit 12-like [Arctopsyche grandis]|uniref:integrator complex subunit 12-like n=1 Tax=Arctopsyche grandis TaxID=121162 RepID=UPI00406D7CCC